MTEQEQKTTGPSGVDENTLVPEKVAGAAGPAESAVEPEATSPVRTEPAVAPAVLELPAEIEEVPPPRRHDPPAVDVQLGHMQEQVATMGREIHSMQEFLSRVGAFLETLHNQQEILQKGMRQMNNRFDSVSTTISAPRIRELYQRLLLLYDLVEPAPAHLAGDAVPFCRLLANQIEEFLAVNGVTLIPTEGLVYDARYHKPVKMVSADDPLPEGSILGTIRKGFRTENEVLRPAHVAILQNMSPVTSGTPEPVAPLDDDSDVKSKVSDSQDERSNSHE